MSETSNSTADGENVRKELTAWDKYYIDCVIPEVADLKALGCSDLEAKEELQRRHEGRWWEKPIDLALQMVTEEQVREARKETREDAIRYVTRMKADGWSDRAVEQTGSVYGEPFASFVRETLGTVREGQIEEWRKRRPKPRPPVSPEQTRQDELFEKLKRQPGYNLLTEEEKDLARGILQWRWNGDNYVRIRLLCTDRNDPECLRRFNKAWAVTSFVKAEMILAGKEQPKRSRRSVGVGGGVIEERKSPKPRHPVGPVQVKEDQLVERLKEDAGYGSLKPEEKRLAQRMVRMRWRGDSYVRIQHPKRHRYDFEYLKTFNRVWPLTDFVAAEMRLVGREVPGQWRTRRPKKPLEGEMRPSPEQPGW